jgi:hypothetical protein
LYQRLAEKASDHEARAQETVWFSSSCDTDMRQFSANPKGQDFEGNLHRGHPQPCHQHAFWLPPSHFTLQNHAVGTK